MKLPVVSTAITTIVLLLEKPMSCFFFEYSALSKEVVFVHGLLLDTLQEILEGSGSTIHFWKS